MEVRPRNGGFALLITLGLISFLLLTLLALNSLVQVESREAQLAQERTIAREHARLALFKGLGALQKAAGPDQRVTARAEILGAGVDPSHQNITGVWDTRTAGSSEPVWLISYSEDGVDPFNLSVAYGPERTVPLLGSGTLGPGADGADLVRAPRVAIRGIGGLTVGNYAFWVSDEGVKASLGLYHPFLEAETLDFGSLDDSAVNRLRFAVPVRNAQELALSLTGETGEDLNFDNPEVVRSLKQLLDLSQFTFIADVENPVMQGGYHHYTVRARGLLTRTLGGGVKKDLSLAPDLLGPDFERYLNFPAYLQSPNPGNSLVREPGDFRRFHRIVAPSTRDPLPGQIVHSVVPIITDFGVQFVPHYSGSRDALLSMLFLVELWNPYSSGLVAEDLIVEISGMEAITMTAGEDWSHRFDVAATFGDPISIRLNREQYHPASTQYLDPQSYDVQVHGPGRLLYWTGPDTNNDRTPPHTGSFANRRANSTRLVLPAIPAAVFPEGSEAPNLDVTYQMPATNLTVTLRKAPENGGEVLAVYENFRYESVDSGVVGRLGSWTNRWLTYRFRIIERGTTYLGDRSLWLKHTDKRTTRPSFGDDPFQDTHTIHEQATGYSPDDPELKNYLNVNQNTQRYYFDRVLSDSAWSTDYRKDIPLFELPRQPLLSLGQLQHLHVAGFPPYSIGNPWGGETLNRVFDEFFFSGIQEGIAEPDFSGEVPLLPHPRLSLASPGMLGLESYTPDTLTTLGEDSGIALYTEGQFNVNSTSARAWEAVLAGSRYTNFIHAQRDRDLHDAYNYNAGQVIDTGVDYPVGFTRFPQAIQELFDVSVTSMDSEFDRHFLNLKPGLTFLAPRVGMAGSDTDFDASDVSLIREFAQALADHIRQRHEEAGRPYFSLNEFISEPFREGEPLLETLLQGNVDPIQYPRLSAGGLRKLTLPVDGTLAPVEAEERTPSWLSQADILTALAPFLSTRSGTFKIRAYGDVVNPVTGEVKSRSWCEAVVQRLITPMDPAVAPADFARNPPGLFGRKFKIISFQWLDESDV